MLASGATSAKTFIVQQALLPWQDGRVTVGRTNVIKLADAETLGQGNIVGVLPGASTRGATRRGDATLRTALEEYIKVRTDLRPRSVEEYRGSVTRHLACWLDQPLRTITREMVEDQLKKIAANVAKNEQHSVTPPPTARCGP